MALPEGVETAAVSFGNGLDILGGNVSASLTIEPVFGGAVERLVWLATGQALLPIKRSLTGAGQDTDVHLPAVDQPGWVDQFGNEYRNWYYRAKLRYVQDNVSQEIERIFQVIMGETVIDLDTLFTEGISEPIVALRYPVRSVGGVFPDETGDVDLGDIGGGGGGPAVDQTARDAAEAARVLAQSRYAKPASGIDTPDLSSTVVGRLNLASTAVQPAALSSKADLVNGVLPTSQLPALATGERVVVASQTAMLALTSAQVQRGDLAIRTDGAGTFFLAADDPSVLESWSRLNSPTDDVNSVNGQRGVVMLGKGDVGLSNVDNTSDASKPVSASQQTALDGKAPVSHTHTTSQISDATSTGRSVMTATSQSAARAAIGASAAPTLLPAGTTSIPLDAPVGFYAYRA